MASRSILLPMNQYERNTLISWFDVAYDRVEYKTVDMRKPVPIDESVPTASKARSTDMAVLAKMSNDGPLVSMVR